MLCYSTRVKKAFSLIELSIVLVILGLLVGGILAGQSLIRAGELRALGNEYNRYKIATYAFRDKYFGLPGDITNATDIWGKDATSSYSCASASGAATTPGTCNGNGDGNIGTTNIGGAEGVRAWQQLSLSGLIEGNYNGLNGSGLSIGTNVPASKLPTAGWGFTYRDPNNAIWGVSATFLQAGGLTAITNGLYLNILKPEEAWNIDTKFDDGSPEHGRVLDGATPCVSPPTAASSLPVGSIYAVNLSATYCYLYFRL